MRKKLTDNVLRALKPKQSRYEIRDTHVEGLVLRVSPSGAMKWTYEYDVPGAAKRTRRRITFPNPYIKDPKSRLERTSLVEARALADRYAAMVRAGCDPKEEKRRPDAPRTFGEACDRWLEEVAAKKNKSVKNQRHFLACLPERVRRLRLTAVTRGHGIDLLEELGEERGKASANNIIATGSSVLNWCRDFEWIESKPWRDIKRYKIKPRKRSLRGEEIRTFWETCETSDSNAARLLQLLLLTGQRKSEILHAGPHQISDDGDWLMIPDSKNDLPQMIFLTTTAKELLSRSYGTDEAFFATAAGTPLKDPRSAVDTIRRRLGPEFAHWQVKDLRNTFVNECLRAGIPRLLVSLCCNHSLPEVDDDLDRGADITDQSYASRGSYLDQMRWAWETWEKRLRGIVSGGGELVVMDHHRRRRQAG